MTTRAILAADIDTWMSRNDLGTEASTIIRMVEAEIARKVRHISQEQSTEITVTASNGSFSLLTPTDFRVQKIRSLSLRTTDSRPELEEVPPSVLRALPLATLNGLPVKFAIEGCNLIFAPTPDVDARLFMVYFERFAPLVSNGDTNNLLTNHYDMYLYCALAHAAELTQDHQQADRYRSRFETQVEELVLDQNRYRRSANFQGTSLRNAP